MQDLRLVGVHDDGTHLLLEGADGSRLRLPLDDALRAAVRQDRSRLGQLQIELDGGLRPRDVQALVRAGANAEEVAARSGWPVEKVRRYEGPILAERAHVADLARLVRMRTRAGGADAPTLATRVGERMRARDVDPSTSTWDSWREPEAVLWTVAMRFVAGGRERRALWSFEVPTQTVAALDDEARWLSAEESPGSPGPLPAAPAVTRVQTSVYDVEAEGGLRPERRREVDGPVDLVTAMRERSAARGRRPRRGRAPTDVPTADSPTDALPITGLAYDPAVDGLPPAAHPRPGDGEGGGDAGDGGDGVDARASEAQDEAAADSGAGSEGPGMTAAAGLAEAEDDGPVPGPDGGADDVEDVAGGESVDEASPEVFQDVDLEDTDLEDTDLEGEDLEGEDLDDEDREDDAAAADPVQGPPSPAPAAPARTAAEGSRPGARRGRAQVPSWDDIMFGSRRD